MLFEPLEPRTLLSVAGAELLAFEAVIDHLSKPTQGDVMVEVQDVQPSAADGSFNPQDVLEGFAGKPQASGDAHSHGEGDSNFSPGNTLDSFPHPTTGGEGSGSHAGSLLDLPRLEGSDNPDPQSHEGSDHLGSLMGLPRLEGDGNLPAEEASEHAGALLDLPRFEEVGEDSPEFQPDLSQIDFRPDRYGEFEFVNDLIDEGAEHFVHEPNRFDLESEGADSPPAAATNPYSNVRGPDLRYDAGYDGVGPDLPGFGPGRFELADLDYLRSRFAVEDPDDLLRELFGSRDLAAATGLGLDLFSPGDVLDAFHLPPAAEPGIGDSLGGLPRLETKLTPGGESAGGQNSEQSIEFDDWLSAYDYFDPYAEREDRYPEPYRGDGPDARQNPTALAHSTSDDTLVSGDPSFDPGKVIDTFHGSAETESSEDLGSALDRMPDLEASADHWRPVSTDLERFLRMLGRGADSDDFDSAVDPVTDGKK